MKPSIKSLCIASLLASALTACGGGGSSGEPVGNDDQTPVLPDQAPQQPNDPQDSQDPQNPQDPQEPETPALPIAKQTGWSISGIETREPLELLKTVMCSQLAAIDEVAPPQSNAECDTMYPGLQSGIEHTSMFQGMPPDTELVKREGCTYVPSQQFLVCAWSYVKATSESSTGYLKFSFAFPSTAGFTPEVQTCAADTPHFFGFLLGRAPVQASGPVVKAPPSIPSGCVGWADLTDFFYHVETGVEVDEYSPN